MLNLNIFENINLDCICMGKPKIKNKETNLDNKLYDAIVKYNISILPVTPNYEMENLYPTNGDVSFWNIFIVGSDKTYILADVHDPDSNIPVSDRLLNHQAQNIIPNDLATVFDSIWDKTLLGKQLQFYMVWNDKLYFVNTYPFFNDRNKVIGAIMFMRKFEATHYKFTSLQDKSQVKHSRISKQLPTPRVSNDAAGLQTQTSTNNTISDTYITAKVKEYMTNFNSHIQSPFVHNSQAYSRSGTVNNL